MPESIDRSLQSETPIAVFQENKIASSSESFCIKKTLEHKAATSGRAWLSCNIQDHLLLHQGGALGCQQQLRFGSDGCLRSLKPLPPDAGLASVDGILRLISIKSSFMFIAFFALVSTKMA